ncbi:hypothetical protein LSTR_LSTR012122 [Laodelphax striatellus]|uniref:Leucine-rich repeat flightless-interacting protein 2 n=1 Tax=Laodelphax striatellus TaxID=195883 RepID=A0A482XUS8_LAOST|nr:hypothetical protein LSTR_LSTR012122 [Laodelphax striatellus]
MENSVGGRRRGTTRHSAEDQALDQIAKEAEARLAAKRQARAEAREIRMRELERQQREAEETADKVYDIYSTPVCVFFVVVVNIVCRFLQHELKEVEDKFRKAMIANAQLDNEKAAAAYQVELLKDRLEEMDENHSQLNEQGLVIVGGEYSSSGEDDEQTDCGKQQRKPPKRALVSAQVAEVLEKIFDHNVRLKKFVEQRNELLDELNRVKLELEEERTRNRGGGGANRRLANGPLTADGPCSGLDDLEEVQREANKLISDYKFRLQKADQDNSTLQATVARLESQVVRYKTAAEVAEKVEDDLKAEKRKLQREYRESQARVEELETAHSHLQKRLDKLKNAKSALLKEL